MNFERGQDIKNILNLGIIKNLPEWMEDSVFDHELYYDVWRWAMEKNKDIIFPYLVDKNGTKWYEEEIHFGMNDNNGLLWESVYGNYLPAVKAVLKVPHLFDPEVFNLKIGTSLLSESFMRGDKKIYYGATNFGAYVQLAMTKAKGNFEIQDALMTYYKKYKDEV